MRAGLRALLRLATLALLGWGLVAVPYLYLMQERLLFIRAALDPRLRDWARAQWPEAEVRIPVGEGVELHGWFVPPDGAAVAAPLLIYFGGNAEEVTPLLGVRARLPGWGLLLVNYRGHGLSGGQPSEAALRMVSDHVVQVLMNLLINAADALDGSEEAAPTIRVETRRAGAGVVLAVTDNGPGIASENLGRIFEPHFTTKPPGRGSGLGLSLCRSLMQQDGGEIHVESAVGQGTTVLVTLPVPAESVH